MKIQIKLLKQSFIEAYLKEKISRTEIALFKEKLEVLLKKIKPDESEIHHKNFIYYSIKDTWYREQYEINIKGREDLVILRQNFQDYNSAEQIKPFLGGRDIKRYHYPKVEKHLIFILKGFTIKKNLSPDDPNYNGEINFKSLF